MGTDAKKRPRLDAASERERRLEMEALNGGLARKRCKNCAIVGCWTLYNRERSVGRVRYVRCMACGKPDHQPVIVTPPTAGPAAPRAAGGQP